MSNGLCMRPPRDWGMVGEDISMITDIRLCNGLLILLLGDTIDMASILVSEYVDWKMLLQKERLFLKSSRGYLDNTHLNNMSSLIFFAVIIEFVIIFSRSTYSITSWLILTFGRIIFKWVVCLGKLKICSCFKILCGHRTVWKRASNK